MNITTVQLSPRQHAALVLLATAEEYTPQQTLTRLLNAGLKQRIAAMENCLGEHDTEASEEQNEVGPGYLLRTSRSAKCLHVLASLPVNDWLTSKQVEERVTAVFGKQVGGEHPCSSSLNHLKKNGLVQAKDREGYYLPYQITPAGREMLKRCPVPEDEFLPGQL